MKSPQIRRLQVCYSTRARQLCTMLPTNMPRLTRPNRNKRKIRLALELTILKRKKMTNEIRESLEVRFKSTKLMTSWKRMKKMMKVSRIIQPWVSYLLWLTVKWIKRCEAIARIGKTRGQSSRANFLHIWSRRINSLQTTWQVSSDKRDLKSI